MKSVSKLFLGALSSRAFPFFLFRPVHLKTYSVKLMFVTKTKEKALQFSQQPSEARRHRPPPRTLLSHSDFSQCTKVSKVSNELYASSCPSLFLRNLISLHKCMMQAFKGSGHENIWYNQLSNRNKHDGFSTCLLKGKRRWSSDAELVFLDQCLQMASL